MNALEDLRSELNQMVERFLEDNPECLPKEGKLDLRLSGRHSEEGIEVSSTANLIPDYYIKDPTAEWVERNEVLCG